MKMIMEETNNRALMFVNRPSVMKEWTYRNRRQQEHGKADRQETLIGEYNVQIRTMIMKKRAPSLTSLIWLLRPGPRASP